MVVQVDPPFSEYSSMTLAIVPVLVHVIFVDVPPVRFSPPFGAVTVTLFDGATVMVKLALLMSLVAAFNASETLTRPCVVAEVGTVHASDPSFGVDAMMVVQVEPAFNEYSSFTLAMVPVLFHVMAVEVPPVKFSPPLGEVTVTLLDGVDTFKGDSHKPRPYVAARILPAPV